MPGDDLARRVGLSLQAVRARSGLSPERVAEAAETSQRWVSRVERGTVGVRLRDAQRLFAAVGARLLVQSAPLGAGADDPDLVGDGADEALEDEDIAALTCRLRPPLTADRPGQGGGAGPA